jgi:hypothetical protein
MIYNAKEVAKHIEKNPHSLIVITEAVKEGYVSCISPVPTICRSELRCNYRTKMPLIKLLQELKSEQSTPCPIKRKHDSDMAAIAESERGEG